MIRSLEAQVAEALVAAGLEIQALDAESVTVSLPGAEAGATLLLGNLRRAAAAVGEEARGAVVERFAALWAETLSSAAFRAEAGPGRLFPRLTAPGGGEQGLAAPWAEPVAGGWLQLSLVIDEPERIRYVKALDLPRWGLSLAAAKASAWQNLDDASAALRARLAVCPPAAGRDFVLEEGDGYDAARALRLPHYLPSAAGFFAILPSRDLAHLVPVYSGGRLDEALRAATTLAERAPQLTRRAPYPLSAELFFCGRDGLAHVPTVFDRPGDRVVVLPSAVRSALSAAGVGPT